jgi:hypothetical protein
MRHLREVLNPLDLSHFRVILGEHEDPTHSATKRRFRVNQIASDETYIAEQAVTAFQALQQDERERLMSDLVWQVTCFVEGSIPKGKSSKGVPLEHGFTLVKLRKDARAIFCVTKPE